MSTRDMQIRFHQGSCRATGHLDFPDDQFLNVGTGIGAVSNRFSTSATLTSPWNHTTLHESMETSSCRFGRFDLLSQAKESVLPRYAEKPIFPDELTKYPMFLNRDGIVQPGFNNWPGFKSCNPAPPPPFF